MIAKAGAGGDRLGIGEIYWFRYDLAEDDRLIEVLSDKGELFFYRLRKHYVYRAGTLPYDPSSICTKMGYKTVRPFNACFEELVAAGLVSVEDGMVRFPHGDRIIAEVQGNRDRKANDGRSGGEAKAASARNNQETSANVSPNFDEVSLKHENGVEENQTLRSSYQKINYHEPVNKTTSVGSKNGTSALKSVGGGGSDVQQVISEFYRIAGRIWGDEAVERERIVSSRNDGYAAEWIRLAGGSVDLVLEKIVPALTSYSKGRGCPSTLGAINRSMPGMIENALKSPSPGYSCSKPTTAAGPSSSSETPVWIDIKSLAQRNWHDEIAAQIKRTAETQGDEAANDFARSVEAIVNGKKARAAA